MTTRCIWHTSAQSSGVARGGPAGARADQKIGRPCLEDRGSVARPKCCILLDIILLLYELSKIRPVSISTFIKKYVCSMVIEY